MVCSLLVMEQLGRGGRTVLDGQALPEAPEKGRFYALWRRRSLPLLLTLALLGGCASSGPAPAVHGLSEPVGGPWDLLSAAVAYAAPRHGLAVLTVYDDDMGADRTTRVRVYELLSVLDQRVLLRAEGDGAGPTPMLGRIEAEWTPFRDTRREEALLATIRDRLSVLKAGPGEAPAP